MIHWRQRPVLFNRRVELGRTWEGEKVLSNQPPYGQPPYDPQNPSGGYPPQQQGGYYPSQGGYPPQQPEGYYPPQGGYQQPQQYAYPGAPVAQPEKGGGFAIAGLILGIVSIPVAIFAICGYITAILGFVFSILGRRALETDDGDDWDDSLDHRFPRVHRQFGLRHRRALRATLTKRNAA